MAYKPSTGDIAGRVERAAGKWEPMLQYGVKSQALANAQALKTAQWAKEQQLAAMKIGFEHSAGQLTEFNKGLAAGTFSIGDKGPMLDAYLEAFNRTYSDLEQFYKLSGVPITQKKETHLTPLFSNIFESWKKKNPEGDSAVLKWGVEDGLWGDVMERIDPSINRDDAQRVWDSLWNEKFKDWEGRTKKVGEAGEGVVGETFKTFSFPLTGAAGELGRYAADWVKSNEWVQRQFAPFKGATIEGGWNPKITFGGQDDTKPIIDPTGEVQTMGMFGGGNGLIDGWLPNMPDGTEESIGVDAVNLEESVDTLKDIEQRAQEREKREFGETRDISQEASMFLTKLLEAMAAYGNEEAEAMLSREFLNLSTSAKREIQNYLMSQ